MTVIRLAWTDDTVDAAIDALALGIAACGLEGCETCVKARQAMWDLAFRKSLADGGFDPNPVPERRKIFYAGRTFRANGLGSVPADTAGADGVADSLRMVESVPRSLGGVVTEGFDVA